MKSQDPIGPLLEQIVGRLETALAERLLSVVLYGSAARGDYQVGTSDLNLFVLLTDDTPKTLERARLPVRWWMEQGHAPPRLLTEPGLSAAVAAFPMEVLDVQHFGRVLSGRQPFAGRQVDPVLLRQQCTRDFTALLMRLREAYALTHDDPSALRGLLVRSYTTFVAIFRGCLFLSGTTPPARNEAVVAEFCDRAAVDPEPLLEVGRMQRGVGEETADLRGLFSRYHAALSQAAGEVERFAGQSGGDR